MPEDESPQAADHQDDQSQIAHAVQEVHVDAVVPCHRRTLPFPSRSYLPNSDEFDAVELGLEPSW